jgi:hypothetical protein
MQSSVQAEFSIPTLNHFFRVGLIVWQKFHLCGSINANICSVFGKNIRTWTESRCSIATEHFSEADDVITPKHTNIPRNCTRK